MRLVALKRVATVSPGQAPDGTTVWPLADAQGGTPFIQGNAEFGVRHPIPRFVALNPPRVAEPGAILLSVRAPVGELNVASDSVAIGRGLAAIQAGPDLVDGYLWWSLHDLKDDLISRQVGSTYGAVDAGAVGALPIRMHSREYQAAVASFLNRECERINELLLAKKHLAALGRIAQGEGVRAELDTDAGALPPQKLGWHVEVLAGHAFPSEGFTDDPSAVRLLRGINVGVGRTDWSESVGWVADDVEPYRRWLLQAGDLVLGLDRPWIAGGIRVAELTHGDLPALLLQRVACLRPFSDCLMSAYVRLWLEHERFFADLGSMMTGVSVPHISPGQVGGFRLPVPDLARQQSVVRRASDAQASVARMETELGSLGSSLDEYRDALITEAVTGKLDVSRLSDRQMDESAHAAIEGEPPEVLTA